jgi:hypothetical protein
MRLRGLSGARDEFHLAAIVQNLKTLALPLGRQQPDGTHSLPEIAHDWISVEPIGSASIATAGASPSENPNATQNAGFFDSIA